MREKIIEIIGHGMERERAECMADEIMKLIEVELYNTRTSVEYYCLGCGALSELDCSCLDDTEEDEYVY